MSAAPGWFPDPGGSGRLRYWDGQQWTEHVADPVGAPGAPQAPEPQQRRPWVWIIAGVVVVALIAAAIGVARVLGGPTGGDLGGGGPVPTATPTVSGWDEQDTPSPSPTTTPTANPTATPTAILPGLCEYVDPTPEPQGGSTVTGGGLSFTAPSGWDSFDWPISGLLTRSGSLYRTLAGSTWSSTLEVGYAPGFDDEKAAAQSVLECYFSSTNDHGYESNEVLHDESITIDGQTGWWLQVRETNADVPGTYAILDAVAIDTGSAQGMSIFWTTAYEKDSKAVSDAEEALKSLRVTG